MPPIHLILLVAAFLLALGAAIFSWPRTTPANAPGVGAALGWLGFACFALAGLVP